MLTTDPREAVQALASGRLCAIPTETVYGLAANAHDATAVHSVFVAKGRPTDHPLIVHIGIREDVAEWITELPQWARVLTDAVWPGPLTIIGTKRDAVLGDVTGGQDTVAVRMPQHELTLAVLTELRTHNIFGIVAPSANTFGHVSPTSAEHVQRDLGAYLSEHDGIILDGGECSVGVESTIVLATGDAPVILRSGALTTEDIERITGLSVVSKATTSPRVSGSLDSHYAPDAKVLIVAQEQLNDYSLTENCGLIAPNSVTTPGALIRIFAPTTDAEYAHGLYAALRSADDRGLHTVLVVMPDADGIAVAIRDRLARAAH